MDEKIRNTVLALTSHLVSSEETPLSPREFWKLIDDSELGEITNQEFNLANFDLNKRVKGLLDRGLSLAVALENLEHQGIWTISAFDENYPKHLKSALGELAPPILHGFGSRSILSKIGIGVVGSRNASNDVLSVAQSAGRLCAEKQIPLVSGAAKGVDQSAMAGCAGAGGLVIGIMADSLIKASRNAEMRELSLDERAVFISPYSPSAPFSVGNAMGRNKLIYGLSRNVLVASSDLKKGGTWAGAIEAINNDFANVLVWDSGTAIEGNKELINKGATGITDIDQIFNMKLNNVNNANKPVEPEQLSLNY